MFSTETSRTIPPMPPKCPCHLPDRKDCGEGNAELIAMYHRQDIDDVTDSVMKVMRICGLKPWEVKRSAEVIKRSLKHYGEVVEQIDRVPRKRFAKESFLHGLAFEAQMSRMDAQMAYAIVKRAFKAFYHGTGTEGRRYASLLEHMSHDTECLWLHAARRTAQIHAAFAGLMHSEEMQFEERIECVYKNLYDVLQTRFVWADDQVCTCGQHTAAQSQAISNTASSNTVQMEVLYSRQVMAQSSAYSKTSTRVVTQANSVAISTASSRHNYSLKHSTQASSTESDSHRKCNCPHLRCCREPGEARESPEITAECSQGPFICRWLPFTEEDEDFPEHQVPFPPMDKVCPPCSTEDVSCDSECTCTCKVCTCRPKYDDGLAEEEHLGERISKTGVEDQDTDFCYVGPFRGSSVERMARLKAREKLEEVEEEQAEEQEVQSECTCDITQHACPHIPTYLTPFRPQKEVPEPQKLDEKDLQKVESEIESESEDLLSKPPPPGVSLETYRCWVKDPSPPHSSEETKPPLVVVMAEKSKTKFQITVKEQHHSNQPAAAPPAPLPKPPVLPNKPTPTPAPAKPPVAPPQPQKVEEDKLTKEDILDIIGLRYR
ncbi:histone-lysine N-methyltransferase SETD1B [Drosophila ficusphila]|uniref:histone-lysine N-methyltransferase SETD1B n=1 Tax=Drosophila ficusphila TaxID=30025 RepID=UPI0007E61C5E|nr:histone-lysine N-methyltransferase SETD1B [Drosophila ficusphila]